MGRLSAVATAGAAAWVVPEILTAKPAAGRRPFEHVAGGGGSVVRRPAASSTSAGPPAAPGVRRRQRQRRGQRARRRRHGGGHHGDDASSSTLAFTGLNIQRDAAVGAALVAGGWAMQHWASRAPSRRWPARPGARARSAATAA